MKKLALLFLLCACVLMPACGGADEKENAPTQNMDVEQSEEHTIHRSIGADVYLHKACVDGQEWVVASTGSFRGGVSLQQVMETSCSGNQCSLVTKSCKK